MTSWWDVALSGFVGLGIGMFGYTIGWRSGRKDALELRRAMREENGDGP